MTVQVHMLYGPPGTGKTTELMRRLEAYVKTGIDRDQIAYCSFTKAAAQEVLRRLQLRKSSKISTIHALVYRLLRVSKEQVVDTDKLKELSQKTGIPYTGATADTEKELALGDEFMSLYQLAVASQDDPGAVYARSHLPGDLRTFTYFYNSYEKWKSANGFLDFNDMLIRYRDGRGEDLDAKVLFIDEAQDLSKLQWDVIRRLVSKVEEVHVGGDDDQAIFEWSGADPQGMVGFEKEFNGTRVVLAQSWRLPQAIYELGNRVILRVRNRVPKVFAPREARGRVVRHGHVWGLGEVGTEDTLVLYRNHSNRKELETYLLENRVPYETMAGWPSPLQGKYAWAIRTWEALRAGHDVATGALDGLRRVLTPAAASVWREGGLPAVLDRIPTWQEAIVIPYMIRPYLLKVPVDAPVKVRLGSIHSAKGREAERVILLTAMGRRTAEAMQRNLDAELRTWYVAITRAKDRLDIVQGPGGFQL